MKLLLILDQAELREFWYGELPKNQTKSRNTNLRALENLDDEGMASKHVLELHDEVLYHFMHFIGLIAIYMFATAIIQICHSFLL